jgi:hypothetical protein
VDAAEISENGWENLWPGSPDAAGDFSAEGRFWAKLFFYIKAILSRRPW